MFLKKKSLPRSGGQAEEGPWVDREGGGTEGAGPTGGGGLTTALSLSSQDQELGETDDAAKGFTQIGATEMSLVA